MNKLKIILAAAGFAVAAGVVSAGNVYIAGENVGTFSGNVTFDSSGNVRFTSATINGSGDSGGTSDCPTGTEDQAPGEAGCQEAPYDACSSGGDADLNTPGCQFDSGDSGGTGGGGTGGGTADCTGVGSAGNGGNAVSYSGFPSTGSGYVQKITAERGKYTSVQFTMPSGNFAADMSIIGSTAYDSPQSVVAISRCPGDFGDELPQSSSCRFTGSTISGMYFTNVTGTGVCTLQAGETYYVNYINGTGGGNSISGNCNSARCGHDFKWRDVSYLVGG